MEQDTYRTALAAVQKICAKKAKQTRRTLPKLSVCPLPRRKHSSGRLMRTALQTLLKSTFAAGKNIL